MKKIKTVLMTLFVCALGYGGYTAYDYITMSDAERFLLQNVEALAIDENESSGWLWKKEWWACSTGEYIEILSSGGGFSAGAILKLTVSLEAELHAKQISYRHVPGGQNGQKSYCKDGWNLCMKDECR